jgi:transcription initiation factor TFIID subunit TAF12
VVAVERGDLAGLAGQQVAAGGVEQRRVDRAQPGRGQRHQQQHQQHAPPMRTEPLRRTRAHVLGCRDDGRRFDRQGFELLGGHAPGQ